MDAAAIWPAPQIHARRHHKKHAATGGKILMRDFFIKDLVWKTASLIFAVLIWVAVFKYNGGAFEHRAAPAENTYDNLPVLVFSATADPRAFQIAPNTVSVTVDGPKSVMDSLQRDQIRPFLDLSGATSAKQLRSPVLVALPKGVTLNDVDPPWIGVTLGK